MRSLTTPKFIALTLSLGLSGACGADGDGGGHEDPHEAAPLASYEGVACPFDSPSGVNVKCGTLSVPESYAQPDGRRIELAVAIFASSAGKPAADPVVYLSGGPGAGAVASVAGASSVLAPILAERAFIAVDQRGTGLSKPALTCPELDAVHDPAQLEAAVKGCRDGWKKQGVDLSQYNTANSARDLAGLRSALGIAKWNPLGTSYGTRLALELMRADAEGLRSVILDSALSPDLDALGETARATERSFEQVFDACAGDPLCKTLFPNLEARFYALLEKLDSTPLVAHMKDGSEVPVDGASFLGAMGVLLYDLQGIMGIPQIVQEAESGDASTMDAIHLFDIIAAGEGLSTGMNLSVVCAEFAPLTSPAKVKAESDGVQPEIAKVFNPDRYLAACPLWGVPALPESAEPVTSDVPTLVLAGAFDPSTPPAWGEHIAKTLPHAQVHLFQAATHGVMLTPCGLLTIATFLHDPSKPAAADCQKNDSSALWTQAVNAEQP
jgi:pimeloyl-ACP methyl ester carboxylesterase